MNLYFSSSLRYYVVLRAQKSSILLSIKSLASFSINSFLSPLYSILYPLFLKIYWETANGAIPSNFEEVMWLFCIYSLTVILSLIAGTISYTAFWHGGVVHKKRMYLVQYSPENHLHELRINLLRKKWHLGL
jgi:hypothetical protein